MIGILEIALGGLFSFALLFYYLSYPSGPASAQSSLAMVWLPVALGLIGVGVYLLRMTDDGRFVSIVVLSVLGLAMLCLGLTMFMEEMARDSSSPLSVALILLSLGPSLSLYYLTRPAVKAHFRQ